MAAQTAEREVSMVRVQGEVVTELPQDLYIPPEALQVFLEAFEGPLDFLLYLIKRNNLDILNIPIARITEQYMEYVDLMKDLHLELAGEYLVMAATLAEIKSRMLLPRPSSGDEEEEDPRAELVRRLQEYECIKKVAVELDDLSRIGRDVFQAKAEPPDLEYVKPPPEVELKELFLAMSDILQRVKLNAHHQVAKESLSVRERMSMVLDRLNQDSFVDFSSLFSFEEGRLGVVVTFIAILELLRSSTVEIIQNEPYSPIHLKVVNNDDQ